MPIPPTAAPSGLNIHALAGGRWEVTCGKCLKPSIPILAVDAAHAWIDLQRLGWTWFVSEFGGSGYALCRKCASEPMPDGRKPRGARRRPR